MREFDDGPARVPPRADEVHRRPAPADVARPVVGLDGGPLPVDVAADVRRASAGGDPLPDPLLARMEGAFGADLSGVRIHRNSAVAPRIQAAAFTFGDDIHLAPGAPGPDTDAGLHLFAHELTHVVQQGATGRIHRKIGFEFEEGNWRPWKVDRGTTWAAAAHPRASPPNSDEAKYRQEENLDARPALRPVARKEKIHVGTGFRLEGDDTPGPNESNIEFVTVPFSEDVPGLQALLTALDEMCAIVDRLAGNKGLPGVDGAVGKAAQRIQPGPPWPYDAWDYVTERAHGLSGSDVHRANLAMSKGHGAGMFKMQATSGVTLADVPALLSTFGTPAHEDPQRTAELAPARALSKTTPIVASITGQAPAMALTVLHRMVMAAGLSPLEQQALRDRQKLTAAQGYLSVVMMYLKGMQIPAGVEGAKARVMFLARNKFSDLYAMLDPAVQRLLATGGGVLLTTEVLAVNNANPLIVLPNETRDAGLTAGQPLINFTHGPTRDVFGNAKAPKENPEQKVVSAYTIGHWLQSVAIGRDHLTATAMATWLQLNAGVGAVQAQQAASAVFESFGEYAPDTSGAQPLALFENRAILPEAHKTVLGSGGPMRDVAKIAYNYLLYEAARRRHGNVRYPDKARPGGG